MACILDVSAVQAHALRAWNMFPRSVRRPRRRVSTPSGVVCLDRRAILWRDYSRQVAQYVKMAGLDLGLVARRLEA